MATIEIDSDGDLRLLVGEKGVPFLVCSKTLARSAPVWKAMLYGPFAESKRPANGQGEWTIELPEDDPSGMEIVLHLVHAQPNRLPGITTILALEATVLTNKYQMTSCLWAVAQEWLDKIPIEWGCGSHASMHGSFDDHIHQGPRVYEVREMPPLEWLWITQELGDLRLYQASLRDFALEMSLCIETGTLWFGETLGHPEYENSLVADDSSFSSAANTVRMVLIDQVKTARLQAFQTLTGVYRMEVQDLEDRVKEGGHEGLSCCRTWQFEDGLRSEPKLSMLMCDSMMLAAVKAWGARGGVLGFVPFKAAEEQSISPSVAQYWLSWMAKTGQTLSWQGLITGLLSDQHKHCAPFRDALVDLRDVWKSTGTLSWKKITYINNQARLSGLQRGKDISWSDGSRPHGQRDDSE